MEKTAHRGGKCLRCTYEATIHEEDCKIHGRVKHQGTVCLTCKIQASLSKKSCPPSRRDYFQGQTRVLLVLIQIITALKNCPTHGESTFRGKNLYELFNALENKKKKIVQRSWVDTPSR
jgi:hypothetical protein